MYKREEGTELHAGSSTGEAPISGAGYSALNTHTHKHTRLQTDADEWKLASTQKDPWC